jgi:hypothetical protein
VPALGRELLRSLRGAAVVPRLIAERPEPEWRLGALTVVVGRGRARLRYARQPVGWARPRAGEIARAWRRALDRLAARSAPPDELLPALAAAYRAILARGRGRPGDRVRLVDLRAALRGRLAGITRAQFAWDLARLRRERRLVVDRSRLDLGVATGHAALHRSHVVWIEDESGGGAFYETFRLVPEAS